jgi:hypothetical protein
MRFIEKYRESRRRSDCQLGMPGREPNMDRGAAVACSKLIAKLRELVAD